MTKQIIGAILCLVFLPSCYKPYDNLNRRAINDEQIEIESAKTEMRLWSTNDLSIHYNVWDNEDAITLNGFVKLSNSVTYSFPRTDFLIIYVYLLNNEGMATSRHTIRPRQSKYNPFPEKSKFSRQIPKDTDTASFAFGYFGNFFDAESEDRGGRIRTDVMDWEIYHSPFE